MSAFSDETGEQGMDTRREVASTHGASPMITAPRGWRKAAAILLESVAVLAWFAFVGTRRWLADLLCIVPSLLAINGCFFSRAASRWLPWKCAACAIGLAWLALSMSEVTRRFFDAPAPSRAARFSSIHRKWPKLKFAIALSGGGYRAAMLHAGVLRALEEKGAPPTNISTVSGGSIIGAYYTLGGAPSDFLTAVQDGRFDLRRELAILPSFLRLGLPHSDFTRIDVQEKLLKRVLLRDEDFPVRAARRQPLLLVNSTDLLSGDIIGFSGDYIVSTSGVETTPLRRDLRVRLGAEFPLSRAVAASGAFPGAFPPVLLNVELILNDAERQEIARVQEAVTPAPQPRVDPDLSRHLVLVDGAVRDNSGVFQLVGTALSAYSKRNDLTAPTPFPESYRFEPRKAVKRPTKRDYMLGIAADRRWDLRAIIESDAGKSVETSETLDGLRSLVRAFELASATQDRGHLDRFPYTAIPRHKLSASQLLDAIRENEGRKLTPSINRASWDAWMYIRDWPRLDDLLTVLPVHYAGFDKRRDALSVAKGEVSVVESWGYRVGPSEMPAFMPSGSLVPHLPVSALQPVPSWDRDLDSLVEWLEDGRCSDENWTELFPNFSGTCAGLALAAVVAKDIDDCAKTFRRISTLDDNLSVEDAASLYRLGQYLVYMEWDAVRTMLDDACHAKRRCDREMRRRSMAPGAPAD